jgi:hypothetical protein
MADAESVDPPEGYLELYKLAVEMADRVSARRSIANSFFLTVNVAFVSVVGTQSLRWYVSLAGIVFAASWWALLKSYRDLNAAKFRVILSMEDRLPAHLYRDEWERLRPPATDLDRRGRFRTWLGEYWELGRIERIVPVLFALIYLGDLLRRVFA